MKKEGSQKLIKWTSKDVALNIVVYLVNVLVIIGLFVGIVYINGFEENSFRDYFTSSNRFINFIVVLAITSAVMALYFILEDRDFLVNPSNSEMLFLMLEISLIISALLGKFVNVFIRPLTFATLLALFITDKKTAIFINTIFAILIFLADTFSSGVTFSDYPSLIVGILTGIVAVFTMNKVSDRFTLIVRSFIISVPAIICALFILADNDWENWIWTLVSSALSGPMSIICLMIFLPLFEMLFRRVSCFKITELTDHKSHLIRKLIKEAPGTFNHSIVVGNIAEACATAIGEDAILARTCAYYHDIGKLRRPEFFSENQAEGVDPHKDLTPELSTNIIKSHSLDGYSFAMKNKLPKEIANVCLEHHGTMPIIYFFDKAKKFTDGEVDIAEYCYAGPKPQSKISAIIMIADGCEAASRTLKDRSRENVIKVVRNIVNQRMEAGQFDECEITIKELNIIIHTVVNNLTGVYHSRVRYPKVSLNGLLDDGDI